MPVQGNAYAAKSTTIEPAAQVGGHARVVHHAVIRGQARIYGDALIGHHARVLAIPGALGEIFIYGTAQIDGHATIGSGADIATRRHLLTITGLGPDSATLTLYRKHPVKDPDNIWRWSHGVHLAGWYGTLDDVQPLAEDWDDRLRDELDVALDLAHERAGQWEDEDVTNPDRKRWQLRDSDLRRMHKRVDADAKRAAGIPLDQPRKATPR